MVGKQIQLIIREIIINNIRKTRENEKTDDDKRKQR